MPTTLETLTATVSGGDGNDTVVSSPAGIDCGPGLASPACAAPFPIGYSVTLPAQPDGSDDFLGWSGGCSGTSTSCTVTMSSAASVTATFGAQQTLKFSVANNSTNGHESVTVGRASNPTALGAISPGGTASYQNAYPDGTLVTITATLDSGSDTVNWGGACAGDTSSTTCNVRMSSDQSVTLTFN